MEIKSSFKKSQNHEERYSNLVSKFVTATLAQMGLNRVYLVTHQLHPLEGKRDFETSATTKKGKKDKPTADQQTDTVFQ